jgi:DNA-binding transcriptional MerR regulator
MSFTIGKLARLTGFSPLLLRAWEKRHGFLQPERLDSGHRRYTPEDLAVLQNVRTLLEQGYQIGEIARKGREQLLQTVVARPSSSQSNASLIASPADDYLDGRHPDIAWSILEALPLAVIVTDKRGLVRWINRGVGVLCGYDLPELYGLSPGRMLQGPGTDRKATAELRVAVTSRRPCSVTILNYHKSGEPYLAQVEVVPLGFGVNHAGFVGTARRLESRP